MKELWGKLKTKVKLIFSAVDWKDVGVRAVKTFAQAFLSCVVAAVSDVTFFTQAAALKTLFISAMSAAASAVWNGVVSPALKVLQERADQEIGG